MIESRGQVEEVKIEEIMKRVRENIRNRMAVESEAAKAVPTDGQMDEDLKLIRSTMDVCNHDYSISSHRPLIGKALVKGRQTVHGEVRRYVDPALGKQTAFNSSVVKVLEEMASRLKAVSSEVGYTSSMVEEKLETASSELRKAEEWISPLAEEIGRLSSNLLQLRLDVEGMAGARSSDAVAAIDDDISRRVWLANVLGQKINTSLEEGASSPQLTPASDASNFLFEETHRGSREVIKEKQSAFADYFKDCRNVLDIGCGRGEFLELMKNQGTEARGIDIDETMIEYCASKGLDVESVDAASYLEKIEDKSLDGIFIDQVVEHLEPDYLARMLSLCYRKLKYGYYLVVETINPLSLVAFSNYFNMDLGHKKPIHPETLRFLYQSVGFRNMELKFMSPVPERAKLKKLSTDGLGSDASKVAEVYNNNIDILNYVLFAPQDYALVGKK